LGQPQWGWERFEEAAAVRAREVMSSPVVTVPPETRLKQVADLLVTRLWPAWRCSPSGVVT
jgi:CBS domain-containing protein